MHPLDLISQSQAIFLDWDGCVFENGALKPGAADFLRTYRGKITVLSNASAQNASQLARVLSRAGASIPTDHILLAGEVALEHAVARFGSRPILLLGSRSMRRRAAKAGLRLSERDIAAVVLLRDTSFSYDRLRLAANSIRAGASLIVANPDLTHPCGANINPETGALLAALSACIDLPRADVTYIGKPHAPLFERALALHKCSPHHALMIGDNPATDIEGARRMGIKSLLLDDKMRITLASLASKTIAFGAPQFAAQAS